MINVGVMLCVLKFKNNGWKLPVQMNNKVQDTTTVTGQCHNHSTAQVLCPLNHYLHMNAYTNPHTYS